MKTRRLFLVIIMVSLFICPLFSQRAYYDYSPSDKNVIFVDEFNDNNQRWWTGNEKTSCYVENGHYVMDTRNSNQGAYSFRKIDIDVNRDFEIEARIKFINGRAISLQSLIWGCSEESFNFLGVTAKQKYRVSKRVDGQYIAYKDWTALSQIDPSGFNTVTLRKIDQTYYFFINQILVHSMPFFPFFGPYVGFDISSESLIHMDRIQCSYLNSRPVNAPPVIEIVSPEQTRGLNIVSRQTVPVSVRALDPDGIQKVMVNNIRAQEHKDGTFSVDFPLTSGENLIMIEATDWTGLTSRKQITVTRKKDIALTHEKRVALIIGNSAYSGAASLGVNPINDALDMAETLKSLYFDVIVKTDADLQTMNQAIREFGKQNRDANIALFFFAGHGMQVDRINYLLPVNVKIEDKSDVSFECVNVNTVQSIMETSNPQRLNLIVLDACRNNPFRSWQRGGASGLADMTPPSGTLIAFATSPGTTASNGNSRNGLYTGELIKQLRIAQRIEDVFINTRVAVERKSGGTQSPWELARLRGAFYLVN